jgi:hypothetical protein
MGADGSVNASEGNFGLHRFWKMYAAMLYRLSLQLRKAAASMEKLERNLRSLRQLRRTPWNAASLHARCHPAESRANVRNWAAWSVCLILGGGLMALAQNGHESGATKMDGVSTTVAGATSDKPFVNSLGMKLVPVPGTKVLFSIWDTRIRDYRAYAEATPGVDVSWKNMWFKQEEDHPVVRVNWNEANAFCAWLTQRERKEEKIGQDQEYRLPTDKEWSVAVGTSKYPWGDQWPPPVGAGNYHPSLKVDNYDNTSPVGSFRANQYGLYDMGGNVWQWCEDWYRSGMNPKALLDKFSFIKDDGGGEQYRVVRGGSWYCRDPELLMSWSRSRVAPGERNGTRGFRCVLVL